MSASSFLATATETEGRSLADAFRAQARRSPEHPAVREDEHSLSYRELDASSDRIAAALLARGPDRTGLVGVVVDRSIRMPELLIGVLKAGLAYVPLDPAYPREHLRYIADDSGLTAVLGDPGVVHGCGLGHLDVIDPSAGTDGGVPPITGISSNDPAYVIYTSGSTGRPKGCVITHGNVLALMASALPLFDFGSTDRWALFHSVSFDFSVWELWGALLSGGTGVCVPAAVAMAPEELLDLLARQRITVLNQVPSVFRALVRVHAAVGSPALALRYVVFGGESVDLDVISDFVSQVGTAAPVLVNMYGITEATVHTTFKRLIPQELERRSGSPIGVPLPHLTVSLRDEDLREVPDGEPGEICIAGAGVASGYLNRPDLTSERFVTLETRDGPQRHYRSGDLARLTADGDLEYLGRNDQQVKVRGFRIEPGEIETVLREHGQVRDAAVVPKRTRQGQILVACVVPHGTTADRELERELKRYLTGRLPGHMVPSRFHFEEGLPLAPSGKLDRRALTELVGTSVGGVRR